MNVSAKTCISSEWMCRPYRRALLLALSGLLTGLTLIFPLLGVLEWLALVPCVLVLLDVARGEDGGERMSLRRAYALGLVFFMSFYLVNFHWFLSMYPLEFTTLSRGAALFVVLFAWWGLSLFQALGAAFVFVVFVGVSRVGMMRRCSALRIPLIAALWIILEWGQTLFWSGVPWGRLALGQIKTPVMLGTAAWLGSYGITLSLLLFNAAIAYALLYTQKMRFCVLLCTGALLFTAGGGVIATLHTASAEDERTLRVAAIQGNLGSADKWDMPVIDMYLHYYELTEQAAAAGAELIVWPETAVPITLFNSPGYAKPLMALAAEYQTTLVVGTFSVDEANEKYNSVMVVGADGQVSDTVYSKRHLVPFGEFVPMEDLILTLLPPLADLVQANVLPGEDAAVFHREIGSIGALICFDSIYEMLALDSVRQGAELLTVSTNDSWFLDSAAAHMHNGQSVLRAVETGRWIVRAASTGVSSVISPTGQLTAYAPALQEDIVYGTVALRDDVTLYTRIGNLVVWLSIASVLLALGGGLLGDRKQKKLIPRE